MYLPINNPYAGVPTGELLHLTDQSVPTIFTPNEAVGALNTALNARNLDPIHSPTEKPGDQVLHPAVEMPDSQPPTQEQTRLLEELRNPWVAR
jgi:hypothetical protein